MAFDLSAGELDFISVNLNGQGDMTDFIAQPAAKLVKTFAYQRTKLVFAAP